LHGSLSAHGFIFLKAIRLLLLHACIILILILIVLVLVALSLFAIHTNYFYVHRYIDMERSIQTKSGLNLILKCLPASFTRLYIYIYTSNCTLDRAEVLYGNIRNMKLYFDKFSGQMKFRNILFQRFEASRRILSNISN